MEANNIMMSQAKGVHGNTVTQFLIDQQAIDNALMVDGKTPLGLVAMFYFDKDGENVSIEWYSTLYDKYFQTRNQISFNMNADCEEQKFAWDGVARAPKGSGTKNDPYLVEEAGNLLWMALQVSEANITNGNSVSFANTYFKQTCDIDLGGLVTRSIGWYHTSESQNERTSAFGGHYDGCGYTIRNGRIIDKVYSHGININWSTALFGCIWGATIENVILEDMTVWSRGVTGGIVGRAVAPRDGSAGSDFNTISNCHVKESCRIVTVWGLGNSLNKNEYGYNTRYRAGIVGSICGIAYATTIKGCTSDVNISVDGEHSMVGGIAGAAGYNSVIEKCAFTGSITLTDVDTTVSPTFGGIVALLAPNYGTETMNPYDNYRGNLTIRNCYNSGSFTYTGDDALPQGLEMHWGGILGHALKLEKFDDAQKKYVIESCYNLYEKKIESSMKDNDNYWLGGIVGKADAIGSYDSVYVKDCSSVEIETAGGENGSTNEYRHTGLKSSYGILPVVSENVKTEASATIVKKIADMWTETDYAALNAAIEEANALKKADYTEKSWSDMEKALAAAKEALNSNDQDVVDEATDTLKAAIKALVKAEKSDDKTDNGSSDPTVDDGSNDSSTATDTPQKTGGCGSSIAASSVILAAVLALGLGLQKKD